ncbi:mobile mystery protein B [endosymbiont of Ridgeia piscesae]|jgi:Fic-DOC domain mobile mystery protein B|uniref:Mobile mystery protein B n=3 Tax=endosymbiont of Ridgeia piscesae TaxID=54398 RepID=A0A0T5Z156_9GAMM|nr:mobile mystery protein B [endosymbiont of Ridgeia piscesae]KRT56578.1 mobile mystery protein B [endosymbiont of Ridgeia piscesae]
MTDPLYEQDDAATPLSEEEREGLIPSYITLRGELNEAEQANILEAEEWASKRKRDVLDERFLNGLHKHMYGRVWRWAGQYRRTGKNIGVDAYRIPMELRQLLDDCRFWIENGSYEPDEIATRFHHKLVWIHAYPNGNGRHARLATDLLLAALGRPRFTWGRVNLVDASETRKAYVTALRAADNHDIGPLLEFVRS